MDDARRRPGDASFRFPEDRQRQADELPARVRRRRRSARPLFDHRPRPRSHCPRRRPACRDQPQGVQRSQGLYAARHGAARRIARLHCREPHCPPRCAAADGGRRVRLSRLRHGAADGGYPRRTRSGPNRHSRRDTGAPDPHHRFRRRQRQHHCRYAGAATARHRSQNGAGSCDRAPFGGDRCPRQAARQGSGRQRLRSTRRRASLEHHARRIQEHGARRQGIHRGRRYFSGRAVAAFRSAVRVAAVRALSRAAPGQSIALFVLPRFRQLRHRRVKPGNFGESRRRHGHDPPDRRHPAARRHVRTKTRRWKPNCWPIPKSAPSI